jgi:hypothetical protein
LLNVYILSGGLSSTGSTAWIPVKVLRGKTAETKGGFRRKTAQVIPEESQRDQPFNRRSGVEHRYAVDHAGDDLRTIMASYPLGHSIGPNQSGHHHFQLSFRIGCLAVRVFLPPLFAATKPMAGALAVACLDGLLFVVRLGRDSRGHLVLDISLRTITHFFDGSHLIAPLSRIDLDEAICDSTVVIGAGILQFVRGGSTSE